MRIPMKPVSFMTSRMSVKGTRGNEFHRLAPSAHRTFLLAGRRPAARASVVPKRASAVRRVIVTDVTRFARRLPGGGGGGTDDRFVSSVNQPVRHGMTDHEKPMVCPTFKHAPAARCTRWRR